MIAFRDALARMGRTLEPQLVCPSCQAANRPGATIIELESPTRAICACCSKPFNPQDSQEPPRV